MVVREILEDQEDVTGAAGGVTSGVTTDLMMH